MAGKSVVKFTPKTEMDFGSLVCWGSNQVGLGSPCVFHLLPIGPPEPPSDCYTHNITYSSVQVLPCSSDQYNFFVETAQPNLVFFIPEICSMQTFRV